MKTSSHVCLGEQDARGEEGDKGIQGFIPDGCVLGGEVDVSGVH